MMNFLKKIFFGFQGGTKTSIENPTLTLLKKALPKGFNFESIQEITSIFSVEYTDQSLVDLKKSITENKLEDFSKNNNFDSLKDAIQLLLFVQDDKIKKMYILFCPVEFYENEYIIDVLEFPFDFDRVNFKESEIIFKKDN